jgi:putative NIF3 family GTP cyclohydrolase 1 type 2
MCSDARTVGALVEELTDRYATHWAEEWDRVGLVAGDPAKPITGVLVTLDATAEAVERAQTAGANVLVTHHPPFLDLPERVAAGPGPGGALEAALRTGVAMVAMHTNLDRSPAGASSLARALGLVEIAPLETSAEPVVVLVTYAPADAVPVLRAAMVEAGAGRIGEYEACAFTAEGRGHFAERDGTRPTVVDAGEGVD